MIQWLKDPILYFTIAIALGLALNWLANQIPAVSGNAYLTTLPSGVIAVYVALKTRQKVLGNAKTENKK